MKKLVLSLIILSTCLISKVFATPLSFLATDGEKYYRYSFQELITSSEDGAMGEQALLFNDYYSKQLIAFEDDQNGYIDSKFIIEQSENDCMNNKKFDLESCLLSAKEVNKFNIDTSIINVKERKGKLIKNLIEEVKEFDVKNIY